MIRTFTDKRFPRIEIRNGGGPLFEVWLQSDDKLHWAMADHFERKDWGDKVSKEQAAQACAERFDFMADEELG